MEDSVEKTASSQEDTVSGTRATGHLGPERGIDTFLFEGNITGLSVSGPAAIYVNGKRIDPDTYPTLPGAITAMDFYPTPNETNTLRIESNGTGLAAYDFSVTGTLEAAPSAYEDTVEGTSAYGHLGPDRGTDTFRFTGDVTAFSLTGPATVYLNGKQVTANQEPPSGQVDRLSPAPEVTVAPDTALFFAFAAPNGTDDISATVYVDGDEVSGEAHPYYRVGYQPQHHGFRILNFTERGTHDVRIDVADANGTRVGSLTWTVHVTPDGNQAPTVERVTPAERSVRVPGGSATMDFTLRATDPDGNLAHVIWWRWAFHAGPHHAGRSAIAGQRDTATQAIEVRRDYIHAWVIDESGAITRLSDSWDTYPAPTTIPDPETPPSPSTTTVDAPPDTTDGNWPPEDPQPYSNDLNIRNQDTAPHSITVAVRDNGTELYNQTLTLHADSTVTLHDLAPYGRYTLVIRTASGAAIADPWRAKGCNTYSVTISESGEPQIARAVC